MGDFEHGFALHGFGKEIGVNTFCSLFARRKTAARGNERQGATQRGEERENPKNRVYNRRVQEVAFLFGKGSGRKDL
jgi:hypothetical protein